MPPWGVALTVLEGVAEATVLVTTLVMMEMIGVAMLADLQDS